MDFKWKLSRPGIELEFETGSISEAAGLLTDEGSTIAEVFGFTMGTPKVQVEQGTVAEIEKVPRKPRAPKVEAVAPPPLPIPTATPTATPLPIPPIPTATPTATLPPNTLSGAADGGIPAFLDRTKDIAPPPLSPPPLLPSPPVAPTAPTPPPVGVLGPKVVAHLDTLRVGKEDGGQALADWLHASGLTQKGATYDDACRVVLMTSDEKLNATGIPAALEIAA